MAKLLQNERTKLYKKPSTWVLSGVVILLMLSTVVLLKVINIISANNNYYYSQADAWKDVYQSNLQSNEWQLENEPDNIQVQMEIAKYKYLLDNEIPPSDWRTDAVAAYYEALGNLKSETAMMESGEPSYPEDQMKEHIAAYTAQVEGYKKVLDNGNWKDFLRLRIEFIKSGYTDSSIMDVPQTPQEQEVFIRRPANADRYGHRTGAHDVQLADENLSQPVEGQQAEHPAEKRAVPSAGRGDQRYGRGAAAPDLLGQSQAGKREQNHPQGAADQHAACRRGWLPGNAGFHHRQSEPDRRAAGGAGRAASSPGNSVPAQSSCC